MEDERAKEVREREWSLDLGNYGIEADCYLLTANSNGTWEHIGNLARRVLSCAVEAREKGGQRHGQSFDPQYAQTVRGLGGKTASDLRKGGGGVDTGVKVFGRTPDTAIQHSPDTDEESSREDRTISYSVDR